MSIEVLLLLVVFFLLPLIERLLRAARERGAGGQAPAPGPPPQQGQPQRRPEDPVWPPVRVPQPDLPVGPPATRPPPASDDLRRARARALVVAREAAREAARIAARDAAREAARHPPPRRARPESIAARLRTRGGLRHAIVLMTILGPCRAAESEAGSLRPS